MSEDKLNTKKWLYTFKVPRKYTKTVKEETKDENGKDITITREEDVVEDVEIFLKRPRSNLLWKKIFTNFCIRFTSISNLFFVKWAFYGSKKI